MRAETADPPAECRACRASLDGAAAAARGGRSSSTWSSSRKVTEWALPGLACPCCGTVTFAGPPAGAHPGTVSCGPALNAAAVLLTSYGNVPPERAAQVIGMLPGIPVWADWVDKAAVRVSAQLGNAGFDEAMIAALAGEDVLGADETPVSVLDKTAAGRGAGRGRGETDPEEKDGKAAAGAPHVLITRTPDGRLRFLQAIGSRRKGAIAACLPAAFARYLITDGYAGYQHLLLRLAGIWKCAQHVIREMPRGHETRSRRPAELGCGRHRDPPRRSPGSRGGPRPRRNRPGPAGISTACASATTPPSPPGSSTTGCGTGTAAATTPATPSAAGSVDYKEQVFLFTRNFAVSWTNNVCVRRDGANPQARTAVTGQCCVRYQDVASIPVASGASMMRQRKRKTQRRGQMPLPAGRQADPFSRVGKPLLTS